MILIAAADRNWGIGKDGSLLVSIPADHRMFRQETLGKVVVYGRKTLETFPMQHPLDRRTNIILSRNPHFQVSGAQVVHSVQELLQALEGYDPDDVYVIGGASIYRQLLPYCDRADITRVDWSYDADAYLPDLDADPEWEITQEGEEQTYFNIPFTFVHYERVSGGSGSAK